MPTVDHSLLAERINELYLFGFASVAALSSVQARVEDDSLRALIEEYLDVSKAQVGRLREWVGAEPSAATSDAGMEDLRHFARELARGLLSKRLEFAATNALLRMADRKLGMYQSAGDIASAAHAEALAALCAGEAEEAGMVESLTRYQAVLRSQYTHAQTA